MSGSAPHVVSDEPGQPVSEEEQSREDERAQRADSLVVVLGAEVGDELFAAQVAQRVLELHELDEQVVLGIEPRRASSGS